MWIVFAPTAVLSPGVTVPKDAYVFRPQLQNSLAMKSGDICMFDALRVLHPFSCLVVILLCGLTLVLRCSFFWRVVLHRRGVGVWVFECCYLLFFKGPLALPWGYCSRNSYLCYSPAYRLLTGTKWKNPAHNVLCFVNMFYCPWFSAIRYLQFCFVFFLSICAYIAWQTMLFYYNIYFSFFHKLPVSVSFQFSNCWI